MECSPASKSASLLTLATTPTLNSVAHQPLHSRGICCTQSASASDGEDASVHGAPPPPHGKPGQHPRPPVGTHHHLPLHHPPPLHPLPAAAVDSERPEAVVGVAGEVRSPEAEPQLQPHCAPTLKPHSHQGSQLYAVGREGAGHDWGFKAKGGDAWGGRQDWELQEGQPDHLRLGDQREADLGRCL